MTTAELLAIPEDGVERWLIRGRLREKPSEYPGVSVVARNRHHSRVLAHVGAMLVEWNRAHAAPRGRVFGGNVGVTLARNPDTTVGIDVVYLSHAVDAAQEDNPSDLIEGVPTLVVEVLSPNDTLEQVEEKIDAYRDAGVPLIWIIDVHHRTVALHRPGQEPELFNVTHTMPASPHMPGFAPTVAELFE